MWLLSNSAFYTNSALIYIYIYIYIIAGPVVVIVECVSNGRSRLRQWTLIITTGQDYNKARGSHVTKRGYTEVLAKPTKYSISPITSNNHCIALMQGFFSLCHSNK